MPVLNTLAAVYLVILVISLLSSLVIYVFNSLGIMLLANKLGLKNGWLGFIPFASTFKFGQIADDCSRRMGERKNYAKLLLGLEIAVYALFIPAIVVIVVLACLAGIITNTDYYSYSGEIVPGEYATALNPDNTATLAIFLIIIVLIYLVIYAIIITMAVFKLIALYKIFKFTSPNNATLFIVLSILFSLTWLFLFITSLKKDIPQTDEPILNDGYDYAASCVYPNQQPAIQQQPVYAAPEGSVPNVYMPPEEK